MTRLLRFDSIVELKSEASKAENNNNNNNERITDIEVMRKLIERRKRKAFQYAQRGSDEEAYFFFERCLILIREFTTLEDHERSLPLVNWDVFTKEIEDEMEKLEPNLSRIYDAYRNREAVSENIEQDVWAENTSVARSNRRRQRSRSRNHNTAKLEYSSMDEVQWEVENADIYFKETKDDEFLEKLIKWRWRAALRYEKQENVEKAYFFYARCSILVEWLINRFEEREMTNDIRKWETFSTEKLEPSLNRLESILSRMYGEITPSDPQENVRSSNARTRRDRRRQIRKKNHNHNNIHTQFTLIKHETFEFDKWLDLLKLRFKTRQWISSLDSDSYKVICDESGTNIGIQVEFAFLLREATFTKRMGLSAMRLVKEFKFVKPKKKVELTCPRTFPWVSYWVIIRDEEEYSDHDEWTENLTTYLDEHICNYKILKAIKNEEQKPIGIYFSTPHPKAFVKFFCDMKDFMRAISYVTKTSKKLSENKLTACYHLGFFNRLEDREFY